MSKKLFVMIEHEILDSPAWKLMSRGAHDLFIALRRRYIKKADNNGRIYLSQRDAAAEIDSKTEEVVRWFRELQHYGFIVMVRPGRLGLNGKGQAPRWRLTDTPCDGKEPTKDFLRWNGVRLAPQRRLSRDGRKTESRTAKAGHPLPPRRYTFGAKAVHVAPSTPVPPRRDKLRSSLPSIDAPPSYLSPLTAPGNGKARDWLTVSSSGAVS
jgi:hypothetical protein